MNLLLYSFAVLLFAACFFLMEAAWLWWSGSRGSGAQRIAKRLRVMTAHGAGGAAVSILKPRRYSSSAWLEARLRRVPQLARLDQLLLQAGVQRTVAQLLGWSVASTLAGLLAVLCWRMPGAVAIGLVLAAPQLPLLLLLRSRAARLRKVEQQLPEAADFLARALRAGHSFSNVMQMVGEELADPIAGEFKSAYQEINYGVPMNEALQNLAARIPLTDLRYLIIAVLIQRESGGNLAEILSSISRIIRARLTLLGQVRVLSAEGKMSAWVLGLLPVVMLGVMALVNPLYISVLWTDPTGIRCLWYAGGMIALGVVWMRRTIRIHV